MTTTPNLSFERDGINYKISCNKCGSAIHGKSSEDVIDWIERSKHIVHTESCTYISSLPFNQTIFPNSNEPLYAKVQTPRVIEILRECIKVYRAKASDYNHPTRGGVDALANFKVTKDINVEPYIGALVRLSDKWERVKSLVYKMNTKGEGPAVKDESVKDTLRDMVNYSAITLALYEEWEREQNGKNNT